jgi:hypothetical protein
MDPDPSRINTVGTQDVADGAAEIVGGLSVIARAPSFFGAEHPVTSNRPPHIADKTVRPRAIGES